ncbi:hypothetical protein DFH09DRAFT_377662 [Mycena vulgaris]|nr:hypothetical protein DFH09DRAFT_377662 [Mycena vulgaris]
MAIRGSASPTAGPGVRCVLRPRLALRRQTRLLFARMGGWPAVRGPVSCGALRIAWQALPLAAPATASGRNPAPVAHHVRSLRLEVASHAVITNVMQILRSPFSMSRNPRRGALPRRLAPGRLRPSISSISSPPRPSSPSHHPDARRSLTAAHAPQLDRRAAPPRFLVRTHAVKATLPCRPPPPRARPPRHVM